MRAGGVAAVQRDLFIDHVDDVEFVLRQLQRLVTMAVDQGGAVGIGHVRPNTLAALKQALPRLKASGHQFVFLSSMVRVNP